MIYCVEDDRSIRELVVYTLRNSGFEAEGFESGAELSAAMARRLPRLLLLDIMLPDEDGTEILMRVRQNSATSRLPIIMLTAKGTEYDKVFALDNGADDYISKPFGMMELISRIKAVLRRTAEQSAGDELVQGRVRLNIKSHVVTVDGNPVALTLKEFQLLQLLFTGRGAVFTRDMLLESIWGYDFDGETRTVDVHIRTLRSKLGDGGDIIETVRGVGYRIGGAE